MISGKQILWGTLGWAFGGPIGGILGVIFAGSGDQSSYKSIKQSQAGDFMVSLLVLFAKVMKADGKLLKSELDYVKSFLKRNLSSKQSSVFIKMFQEILKQDYSVAEVCGQIQKSMDHPSRLELLHVLFGLSASDGEIHPQEGRRRSDLRRDAAQEAWRAGDAPEGKEEQQAAGRPCAGWVPQHQLPHQRDQVRHRAQRREGRLCGRGRPALEVHERLRERAS